MVVRDWEKIKNPLLKFSNLTELNFLEKPKKDRDHNSIGAMEIC